MKLIAASSRATVTVIGSAEAADTVTETPGSRSVNVLVDEVMACSTSVPFQSDIWASCAAWISVNPTPVTGMVKAAVHAGRGAGELEPVEAHRLRPTFMALTPASKS